MRLAKIYTNKSAQIVLPDDFSSLPLEARKLARRIYNEAQERIDMAFKAALEDYYGIDGHPKADKLWALAWEYGHSGGYNEVECYYDELVVLLN